MMLPGPPSRVRTLKFDRHKATLHTLRSIRQGFLRLHLNTTYIAFSRPLQGLQIQFHSSFDTLPPKTFFQSRRNLYEESAADVK